MKTKVCGWTEQNSLDLFDKFLEREQVDAVALFCLTRHYEKTRFNF